MAKIQSFAKSRLKINELLSFCQAVYNQILTANPDITKFQPQLDKFKEAIADLDASSMKILKSSWTDTMKSTNKVRNQIRSSIFSLIRGYNAEPDGENKKAAVFLMPMVDRYKGIYNHSFDDQTGYYFNLIEASRSDEFKTYVEQLKLDASFTKLQTANNECAHCSSNKSIESAKRNMPLRTSVSRKNLIVAYDNLVFRLNSLAEANGDSDFIILFSWWNEEIDKFRVTFSNRYGKGKGGKTAGGDMSKHDPKTGLPYERPGIL